MSINAARYERLAGRLFTIWNLAAKQCYTLAANAKTNMYKRTNATMWFLFIRDVTRVAMPWVEFLKIKSTGDVTRVANFSTLSTRPVCVARSLLVASSWIIHGTPADNFHHLSQLRVEWYHRTAADPRLQLVQSSKYHCIVYSLIRNFNKYNLLGEYNILWYTNI